MHLLCLTMDGRFNAPVPGVKECYTVHHKMRFHCYANAVGYRRDMSRSEYVKLFQE